MLLVSCNTAVVNEKKAESNSIPAQVIATDSMTTKIKTVVEVLEKQELSSISFLKQILLDSVEYKMISEQDYFTYQKEQLKKMAHFSANKEKTQKALEYLTAAIENSNSHHTIYKVDFHMNAQLSNNSVYNEHHIKFLYGDFTEVKLVFPK
ncbi:MAG: hypothetical protein WCI49_13690 [Ferruginibacter sp.]